MSNGSTLFFGRMTPREALSALGADLVARGALHPAQLARALPLVDAGRLPATALLDIGVAADAVLQALATVTGLAVAPARARWVLDGRAALAVPAATWQALLCVPIGSDGGRPLIAWADPARLASSLALTVPPHTPCAALEADIKDALAVTPAPQRSALSFLAPPSAVSVSSSSQAFDSSTRPALGNTLAGVLPPLTGAASPAPSSSSPLSSPSSPFSSPSPPAASSAASSAAVLAPLSPPESFGLSAVLDQAASAAVASAVRVDGAVPRAPAPAAGVAPPTPSSGTLVFGHATSPFSSTPPVDPRGPQAPPLPASPVSSSSSSSSLPGGAAAAPLARGTPSGQVTAFMSPAALADPSQGRAGSPTPAAPASSPVSALSAAPLSGPSSAPVAGPSSAPVLAAPPAALSGLHTARDGAIAAPASFAEAPDPTWIPVGLATVNEAAPTSGGSGGVDVGSRCGNFLLERRIGEGGMASVFLGVSTSGPTVRAAIKVVHEHLLRSTAGEELRRRFEREALAMRGLQHKNIVGLVDAGRVGGTEYLATEFIAGGTLSDLTRRTGKLPPLLALSIFADLLDGLREAHAKGVVHRDLKPENLLLDTSDDDVPVKIADFGIARLAEGTRLTGTDRIIGTPAYMSPEQATAQPMDGRTDLYTAAVIVYELITGRNPFAGASPMATLGNVITGGARPLGDVEPAVPFLLDVVVAKLLALRPDDRYATAADVLRALQPLLERARAHRVGWAALAREGKEASGKSKALDAAVAAEANAWAALARAGLNAGRSDAGKSDAGKSAADKSVARDGLDERAALIAHSAFRATSLNPDHADARGVLSALESRGKRFQFTRSTTPDIQAAERLAPNKPVLERREAWRALGDACFAEGNPRFASQWWRRAVAEFGLDDADLLRLQKVIPDFELAELQGRDTGLPGQRATTPGRTWKPPPKAEAAPAKTNATTNETNANATNATTTNATTTNPLPRWLLPLIVALVLAAFAAGLLLRGGA